MEPITITVITYVSLKFIDQFLKEEGYGKIKKLFFPEKKYKNRLVEIIYKTIEEHEKQHPFSYNSENFPFYHSQILFDELNKYVLFKTTSQSQKKLIECFNRNPNIIIPSNNELDSFYTSFVRNINADKLLKNLFVNENYKLQIYEATELLENIKTEVGLIQKATSALEQNLIFNPNDSWFITICRSVILDLGNRYTPELNFELEVLNIFEGIGRTKAFEKMVSKQFDLVIIKGKKVLSKEPEIQNQIHKLEAHFDELFGLYTETNFCDNNDIPISRFIEKIIDIESVTNELYTYYREVEDKLQKEKNSYEYYHKYGSELRDLRVFEIELSKFKHQLNSDILKLANNPFLILDGEAGIGKSHMIGDIVSKRINHEYESIFLLGQQFVSDEAPWIQILRKLQINNTTESFLVAINDHGQKKKKRIIIFIDAINEGRGKFFWNDNIKSFVNEIRNYKWLGLVLTVRTSYKNLIFPATELENLNTVQHTLFGFRNTEYEASKLFFTNYNIQLPNVPLLHPEFQNPLFLKLFCEGINKSGLSKIPDGLQGITSIINFFISNVNTILSNPKRFDYANSINLVSKSIHSLIRYKVNNDLRYVPYDKAVEIVEDSVSKFVTKKGTFLEELISEGIFSKNIFLEQDDKYEEGIYLAYERFEDHLLCQYLLEKYSNLNPEFQVNGNLFKYIADNHALYMNKGLIDAFSIQIPELTGKEFYDYIPAIKDQYVIAESFVQSLLWRKIDTITETSLDYINKVIFSYPGTYDLFAETLISIAAIPNHFYNANCLHRNLISKSLAQRDSTWTQDLKYKYSAESSVKRLIDWAWQENDKSHISNESLKLAGIALTWFLTSTNRQLRDCTTKALVSLLQDRIEVLIEILQLFEDVNDPYVYERIFSVAYGCALRTSQKDKLKELSEYIFKRIFDTEGEVYPHVLLRDYARGVIEYTNYLRIDLGLDLSKIRPPYKSNWPDSIPSYDELKEKFDNDDYYYLWDGVMGFSDFARYTIGTNHYNSAWSGFKKSEIPIDREKVFEHFKSILSPNQLVLLESLNPIITEETGQEMNLGTIKIKMSTAVGRKTEDQLLNNKRMFERSLNDDLLGEYKKEIEPYLDHNNQVINTAKHFDLRIAQRLIFSLTIELGWKPELHLEFDKNISSGRGRSTKPNDRIGKKYQWIAYYEYMAKLSDNFIKYKEWGDDENELNAYQGPWDPYIRDIDPTMLIYKTGTYEEDEPDEFWWSDKYVFDWSRSKEDWIANSDDLPKMESLIEVKDLNGEEWLVLEGYPEWAEPRKIGDEKWDYPHKRLWCQIKSYLVKGENFDKLKSWAVNQDFMGRWMPEASDRYEVFSREYYWSPAHKYFEIEYYGGKEWVDIRGDRSGKIIAPVMVTTKSFAWGEEFDYSKESSINFLKPCTSIYKGMKLKYVRREGEFINGNDEVVCFAANVYQNSRSYLMMKKLPFISYLKENNLQILWTVLAEKQIIGGRSFREDYIGRLEISGAYYLNNDSVSGISHAIRK